jgi:hypothetical protein
VVVQMRDPPGKKSYSYPAERLYGRAFTRHHPHNVLGGSLRDNRWTKKDASCFWGCLTANGELLQTDDVRSFSFYMATTATEEEVASEVDSRLRNIRDSMVLYWFNRRDPSVWKCDLCQIGFSGDAGELLHHLLWYHRCELSSPKPKEVLY